MAFEAFRYLRFGYVTEYYVEPTFHFTFLGWGLAHFPPPWLIYGIYGLMAVCGLCLAWGFAYRAAAITFTLAFGYVFLLDTAYYLNHYYVILLVAGFLAVSPASFLHGWEKSADRGNRAQTVPTWSLWGLRALLQIIYVYAAVAKLNPDWLAAEPLRTWLRPLGDESVVGWLFRHDATFYAISYLGILLDGVVAPLLLFRRTRTFALIVLGAFHLSNELIFRIGVFPLVMLSANLLFLPPSWPRRLPAWLRDQLGFGVNPPEIREPREPLPLRIVVPLALFFSVQLLLPLRHHLYPGDVAWTEEGHRFAWRMKLRTKIGTVEWQTTDADGNRITLEPQDRLTKRQQFKLACHPEMLVQYARHLADAVQEETGRRPPVFARTRCSVNAGPFGPIVDPEVDLARASRSLLPAKWILPRPHRNEGVERKIP